MHVLVLLEDLERQKVAKSSVCVSNVCLVVFSFSLVAVVEDDALCSKSRKCVLTWNWPWTMSQAGCTGINCRTKAELGG